MAMKVLHAITRLNRHPLLVDRCHFECFDNCREQGFVLQACSRTTLETLHIAFSENRNSDDVVVYCYTNTAFPTNLPATDADWQDKKYFRFDAVEDAARYVIERAYKWLKG